MSGHSVPKGNTVLVYFPFTDLSSTKLRPALVIYEGDLDVTIAPMTTQRPHPPLLSDLLIRKGTSSFRAAGLKEESWLLIDKISTLEKTFIVGILGEADDNLKREVNEKIAQCLMFNDASII
ncbi:MAG: mRNA interferase MazF [Candidatus Poribacteria bacterium]|nr:mRNA interferase MazF [Candidatus Poribacteria bacterium]